MTHATPGNYHTFFINSVIKQLLPWVSVWALGFFFYLQLNLSRMAKKGVLTAANSVL